MRRAFRYTPFDVTNPAGYAEPMSPPSPEQVNVTHTQSKPKLPMDTPTLAFRNRYNTPSETLRGIETRGSLAFVVPVQRPHAAGTMRGNLRYPRQGTGHGDPLISSNTVTGGVVKGYITNPNSIRIAVMVARNLYSPTSHPSQQAQAAYTARIPPRALKPSKDLYYPKSPIPSGGKGMGGNFTIPAPFSISPVPTSTTWLRGRFQ